jgi:serine/threonine protein kinase
MAQLQPGDPEQIGRFRLLARLGTGGMGRVYLAHSPGGMRVAVKVIHSHLAEDENFRARFKREVAAARMVSGAFTAPVVAAEPHGLQPWVASVYVPGPSLATVISQRGPLDVPTVTALAAGLAEGLSAVHEAGVIHRDLTPANVLLSPDGPRIIDFGISAAAGATTLTGTGQTLGTPAFMSPEQALAQGIGQPSDIFSLGAVLTFTAKGEGPFGTGDYPTVLLRMVQGAPDLDGVPAELRPLLMRCLNRDPDQRPTALAFLAEVTAAFPAASTPMDWARLITAPSLTQPVESQPRKAPARVAELAQDTIVPPPAIPPPAPPGPVTQTFYAPRTPEPAPGPPPWSPPSPPPRPGWSRQRRRLLWLAPTAAVVIAAAIITPLALLPGSPTTSSRSDAVVSSSAPTPVGSSSAPARTVSVGLTAQNGQAISWYRTGDCLNGDFPYAAGTSWPAGSQVPCGPPHDAEVYYANFQYWAQDRSYPGPDVVAQAAFQVCDGEFTAYDGVSTAFSQNNYVPLWPDPSGWSAGQRYITCVAFSSGAPVSQISGSILGTRQ